jgi:DNA-binding MarR family transcriptional regulator
MLALIHRDPGSSVTEVARKLKLQDSQASLGLRALESRGLLTVKRVNARVRYYPRIAPTGDPLRELTQALSGLLQRENAVALERIYRLATAFAHPRRIEILGRVGNSSLEPRQIARACRLSEAALARHLRKLRTRGLLVGTRSRIVLADPTDNLTKALIELAGAREGTKGQSIGLSKV